MTGQYWDETWNVVVGCDPVSDGCKYCFAVPAGRIRTYNPNAAVAAAWAGTVTPRGTDVAWTGKVNQIAVMLGWDTYAVKMGADKAGRELDGRTWDELPAVRCA